MWGRTYVGGNKICGRDKGREGEHGMWKGKREEIYVEEAEEGDICGRDRRKNDMWERKM